MSTVHECIFPRKNVGPTTIAERKILRRKTSGIFPLAVTVLMLAALVLGVEASPKKKTASPKKDPLGDYLQRVSGPVQPNLSTTTIGSLWIDNGRLANLVTDYKASRVGDLVTISVSQNLSSTNTGNIATNRSFSASSGITALGGHIKTSGVASLFSPTSTQALTGKAQATSTTALSTTLTGRVVAVLPSGTLIVEAERQIVMNDQREIVILRGMVRTGDLDATNTVASNQVGNLEVEVKGKGIISEGVRSPNPVMKWILRIVGF
ncbi:MAG: flagellar basal body L-ring protein FlgH [Candidatus Sulfotelmatobacter sp.]